MRKMRILVAMCFLLIVTPMLMGARSITWSVTTNPGGNKGQIQGSGSYTLNATDTFVVMEYVSTNLGTAVQYKGADGTGGGTWSRTLTVPAGMYSPNTVTMYYNDANNVLQSFDSFINGVYTVN